MTHRKKKGILILTPFFSPNIGGVETHLDDAVLALDEKGYDVFVQTYSPITTPGVPWKQKERWGENIFITRYAWFGKNLFHKVENHPLLDFLYLTPYLLIRVLLFMMVHSRRVSVVHAQGLNAACIGLVLKKLLKKKLVVSLHAVYEIQKDQAAGRWMCWILERADAVLGMSRVILEQFQSLGMAPEKLAPYKYWVDVDRFKPLDRTAARKHTGIKDRFTVLFVGRLIEKKGAALLIDVAQQLRDIQFAFVGTGPQEPVLAAAAREHSNIDFLGRVDNADLAVYYNSADIYCIPSQYEEGFGRVGMEAVACGIPVVGSNRGGITEALDETVSVLVDPTVENITSAILKLHDDADKLLHMKKRCREYAVKNFSKVNIDYILRHY